MKVLSIVTNKFAPFYQNQTVALERNSIEIEHCYPRKQTPDTEEKQKLSRTRTDYLAMYGDILRESTSEYDLVHANNGPTAPFALAQPQRPLVITFWGSDLMSGSSRLPHYYARFADHVIVPSNRMLDHLDGDATVIPFGIDTDLFSPIPKEEAREVVGWDQTKRIVLFPASPDRPVKNYELAESVIESLSSEAELRVLTGVPHDKVPYYMNASDAVLLTSKRESGPLVVKEAALCNVPVISTDIGFAAEALSDVTNSHVCDSKTDLVDKLDTVLTKEERSDGRKHRDEWGFERMSEKIVEVYKSTLDNS